MATTYPTYSTMVEFFYHWERETPNNTFLRQPSGKEWKELTFAEAGQEARKMATALKEMGLKQGDHIAIFSKNCYHWLLADIAIMMGGYVSVPLYASLPKHKLQEVMEISDSKAIFLGKLDDWGDRAQGIPEGVHMVRFPHYPGNAKVDVGMDWDELVAEHEPQQGSYAPDPDSLWTLMFTSGTTGTPKGVMHLHRTPAQILVDEQEDNWLGLGQTKKKKHFSFLPLNHVAERVAVESASIASGGSISFVENIDTFAQNIQDTQPSVIFAVPRIWTKFYLGVLEKMPQEKLDRLLKIPIVSGIVKKKLLKALGLSDAEVVATGAAITPAYLKTWYQKLGIHLIEAYGMTEVCGSIANSPMKDCPPESVGKSIPRGEVKIHPETGEILMKTPYMMTGYYKEPELTNKVLIDGWMHSGDRGSMDAQGYIRVTGRVKDVFKSSKGKFITPNPLEEVLAENDFVEQVCVAGLGCPQPLALVNLSEIGKKEDPKQVESSLHQSLTELNAKLANYEKVSTLVIDQELWSQENEMLTPTLKVRRGKLDETYMQKYVEWHESPSEIIWHK